MADGAPVPQTVPAVAGQVDAGLIRQAMAYRVKYRIEGGKRLMGLSLLGVHPQNRGGVYPSPETVRNLGLKLLKTGFSVDEANHEGACVQEVPSGQSSVAQSYKAFNMKGCNNVRLQACFTKASDT